MDWLKSVLGKVGEVVDAAVPFFTGARTKIAVIACPVLGIVGKALPIVGAAVPVAAPIVAGVAALLPTIQGFLCGAAPAFALAGLVRKSS